MKTHLRLFYLVLLLGAALPGFAQINYSEDFEEFEYDWEGFDFDAYTVVPCEGDYSFTTNLFSSNPISETISPSLGVSNGMEVTLTYSYKIMDYNGFDDPVDATLNSADWGAFEISYSDSPTGTFTVIETINTTNHVESVTCAMQTVTFTPPTGDEVYIKITAEIDDTTNDFYIIIDDITAVQELPECTGTPAASVTIASTAWLCNDGDVTLSLAPAYSVAGLSFQWQSSTDGETFTDVAAGGDEATFTTTQAETTWYQAIITCDASTESVTSTPVQVVSNGLNCLCDIEFDEDIEPITLVNFAGINNVTDAEVNGTPGVEDFTELTPGEVATGETYTITLEGNTNGSYETYFTVFIDFNQNGDLTDPGESFEAGFVTGSDGEDGEQAITSITIPEDALEGITHIRVLKLFDSYTVDPCSSADGSGYGQAEDYLLNITAGGCATPAPTAEPDQFFCGAPTIADLDAEATGTIVWYADEIGGEPLTEETTLIDGETYYAAQVDGCESEDRTEVTVVVPLVLVDELEDVTTCDSFELPAHDFGEYYTGPGATGEMLETGDLITESMTVYIYSESGTTPNCTAETSFEVTIIIVGQLTGEFTQTFDEGATIADLVVTGEDGAVIEWFASEEDAIADEGALSEETVLEDDTYYYATQTVGDCRSVPIQVLVDITLGVDDFNSTSLTYYPNPVRDVFTISSEVIIDNIEVYNIVGQQVFTAKAGKEEANLNLSGLSAGTYMVKIMAGESVKTIKIVKE